MNTFAQRLEKLIIVLAEKSQAQMGPDKFYGPTGPLLQLAEDLNDLRLDPKNVTEYANCFLCLLDALRRAGLTFAELVIESERLINDQRPREANSISIPAANSAAIVQQVNYPLGSNDAEKSASITQREPEMNDSPVMATPDKVDTDLGLSSADKREIAQQEREVLPVGETRTEIVGQPTPAGIQRMADVERLVDVAWQISFALDQADVESVGMLRDALEPFIKGQVS